MSAGTERGSELFTDHEGFPTALRPMQAVAAEAPFSADGYIFEVKWDGLRCICFIHPDGRVRLQDRRLNDISASFPEVVAAAARLPAATILDGELVTVDGEGRTDIAQLRRRLALGPRSGVPVTYLVFDLLWLAGRPQLRQPLLRRRARLRKTVTMPGPIFVPDYIDRDGAELFEACLERGLSGVMAKHVNSTYVPGQRSPFWLEVKAVKSDDFVVVGWIPGDPFEALLVGYHEDGRLLPCGSVVGGYDREVAEQLAAELERREVADCPLTPAPVMTAPVRWVRPEIVISVRYSEWSPDGTLRFPIFNEVRPEIHPAECVRHRPRVVIGGRAPADSPAYQLTRFPF